MAPLALRGLIFGIYALVAYAIFFTVPRDGGNAIWLALWFALGLGFAGQLVFDWRRTRSLGDVTFRTALAMLSVAVLLVVLWVETLICVAIILPVALAVAVLGLVSTRMILARFERQSHLCAALLALPLLVPVFDLPAPTVTETVSVSTTVTVEAPVRRVRSEAENVSVIAENELPWTFTHNLLRAPRPLAAHTAEGIRHASWTKGIRFREHLLPGPDLAWRFVFPEPDLLRALDPRIAPTGPEVTMLEGRYRFEPLSAGRTRVTLTTSYQLSTPVNAYLKPWGRLFLNDMHHAVLHVITNRAEAPS